MHHRIHLLIALCLSIPVAAAARNDNDRFGEVKVARLHPEATRSTEGDASLIDQHQVSKVPWVGSWWAYLDNGIALCWDQSGGETCYEDDTKLSPAEKLDAWAGRSDKIDRVGVKGYLDQIGTLNPKAEEKKDLIKKINRWVSSNPGKRWQDTDDGKRYLAVVDEIETGRAALPKVDVDTATEFEVMKHGNGVEGVEAWWGHCNAWSAAAIMDPEPRQSTTVDGIEFTAADLKSYLTESWMEHRSSFYGSRSYEEVWDSNGDGKTDWADADLPFKDVTPAALHIFLADQIGNRDKSFVIDRYTGSQVWNQPMRGFRTEVVALYSDGTPEDLDVQQTTYGYDGKPKVRSLGTRKLYPVLVSTTIHWITDGVPYDELTVENINDVDDASDFGDAWAIRNKYEDQVEVRTLTYRLYLSAPLDDPEAEIIGDGVWEHASMIANHNHPDFMWQPEAQGPSRRDYENPYVPYQKVVDELLTGAIPAPDVGNTAGVNLSFSSAESVDIPDNDTTGVRTVISVAEDAEVTSLTVIPDITHTWRGDLQLTLRKGRRWKVIWQKGTGGSADDLKEAIDVPHYVGDRTAGDWTLVVEDGASQDTGTLAGWTIVFNQ